MRIRGRALAVLACLVFAAFAIIAAASDGATAAGGTLFGIGWPLWACSSAGAFLLVFFGELLL